MILSKVFNIRTGLIVTFSLMLISYAVLAVFYTNSIYNATKTSPNPTIDVLVRTPYDDGSTLKLPSKVVAGEPFVYETRGKKLVENSANVRFQLSCKVVGNTRQITSLGVVYSNLAKGDFTISRSFTIPANSQLQSSDDCTLQTISTYTFYMTAEDETERSFDVIETAESNKFKLVVPTPKDTK